MSRASGIRVAGFRPSGFSVRGRTGLGRVQPCGEGASCDDSLADSTIWRLVQLSDGDRLYVALFTLFTHLGASRLDIVKGCTILIILIQLLSCTCMLVMMVGRGERFL